MGTLCLKPHRAASLAVDSCPCLCFFFPPDYAKSWFSLNKHRVFQKLTSTPCLKHMIRHVTECRFKALQQGVRQSALQLMIWTLESIQTSRWHTTWYICSPTAARYVAVQNLICIFHPLQQSFAKTTEHWGAGVLEDTSGYQMESQQCVSSLKCTSGPCSSSSMNRIWKTHLTSAYILPKTQ